MVTCWPQVENKQSLWQHWAKSTWTSLCVLETVVSCWHTECIWMPNITGHHWSHPWGNRLAQWVLVVHVLRHKVPARSRLADLARCRFCCGWGLGPLTTSAMIDMILRVHDSYLWWWWWWWWLQPRILGSRHWICWTTDSPVDID